MTLEQLITKLNGITEWQKRSYRQYREVKWEYRIIIVLLFLNCIENLIVFLKMKGVL